MRRRKQAERGRGAEPRSGGLNVGLILAALRNSRFICALPALVDENFDNILE
jgi:hypothetical protein